VRAADKPIRIGVLTDMTGAYAANTGPGSVLGAQLAVEDFMRTHPDVKAEVVQADLQLKPDVALAIAADWYDNKGVDVVTDVPLSSAAFAIGDLAKQKDKVAIFTGGASADITGTRCGPNHLHWVYDTWSMPHGVVDASVKEGATTRSGIRCRRTRQASSQPPAARCSARHWRHSLARRTSPRSWYRQRPAVQRR
jgi:branched-chain amino acid transport system substrate-binding protein